jgi:hypothetical protein
MFIFMSVFIVVTSLCSRNQELGLPEERAIAGQPVDISAPNAIIGETGMSANMLNVILGGGAILFE